MNYDYTAKQNDYSDIISIDVSNAVAGNGLEASAQYIKAFEADSADISDKISLYGGNADYIAKRQTIPQEYNKKILRAFRRWKDTYVLCNR